MSIIKDLKSPILKDFYKCKYYSQEGGGKVVGKYSREWRIPISGG